VSRRLESEDGISFTEFSYLLLQAYDFLQLFDRCGCTLQMGGSDQWGNITAGMELIRRTEGGEAHALTFPLVTNASGSKFGKTESGNVWLDPERTSPYQFYQFWINIDDRDVGRYLRYFTLLSRQESESLEREVAEHPETRKAQQALATDVTTRVHGADASRVAEDVSRLEHDLLDLAAGPLSGDYRVSATPHRELCATCPGRRAMCSWPEEMTLRETPEVLLHKQ